jgi:DNA-binding transcriptional LysR family regulator
MELRQLQYVVELVMTRSFTRAAERLGVAQPALSQAIAMIEDELGVALFDRRKRPIAPTAAGRAFAEHAKQILQAVDALEANAREYSDILRGRVDLGTMLFLGATALPRIVADFHRAHEAIEIVLHQGMTADMLTALHAGELDVAFINTAAATTGGLEIIKVGTEELAIAAPPAHRLAEAGPIDFADLADEPFIVYQAGSGVHATFIAAARDAGFIPKIVMQSRDSSMLRALVSEGIGVCLLPIAFLRAPGPKISIIRLRQSMVVDFALALSPSIDLNPAARAFATFLRDLLAGDEPPQTLTRSDRRPRA